MHLSLHNQNLWAQRLREFILIIFTGKAEKVHQFYQIRVNNKFISSNAFLTKKGTFQIVRHA